MKVLKEEKIGTLLTIPTPKRAKDRAALRSELVTRILDNYDTPEWHDAQLKIAHIDAANASAGTKRMFWIALVGVAVSGITSAFDLYLRWIEAGGR